MFEQHVQIDNHVVFNHHYQPVSVPLLGIWTPKEMVTLDFKLSKKTPWNSHKTVGQSLKRVLTRDDLEFFRCLEILHQFKNQLSYVIFFHYIELDSLKVHQAKVIKFGVYIVAISVSQILN